MNENTNPSPSEQPPTSSSPLTQEDATSTNRQAAAALAIGTSSASQEPTPDTPPTGVRKITGLFGGFVGFVFSWFIFPILIVLVLHNFVFQAYHVVGTSMIQTLQNNDYLIISKIGATKSAIGHKTGKGSLYIPSRGQVIVFHYPKQPDLIFVKRVVGLPGERVTVKDGIVTVYNQAHPNGFLPDVVGKYEPGGTMTLGDIDEKVAVDSVFVLGDNRTPGGSLDSREWGDLPSSYIIGNAVLRLLPLDKIAAF